MLSVRNYILQCIATRLDSVCDARLWKHHRHLGALYSHSLWMYSRSRVIYFLNYRIFINGLPNDIQPSLPNYGDYAMNAVALLCSHN